MKKFFLIVTILILGGVSGFIYHNYSMQDQIIFRSTPLKRDFVYELDYPYEEVFLPTSENGEINALWFHQEHSKGVVLFFHGRGKNLSLCSSRAYPFIKRGYDVLIIDYRGFGKSSKGYKEAWLLEDGEIAYHFLLNHYSQKEIIVYGHSMGTSIATWVASTHSPRMLVLEAPFYSMLDAASYTKPLIPEFIIKWILKYPLRTDQWIEQVKSPVYIFHGVPDTIVPLEQSQKLYAKIKHKKSTQMIILPNATHSNIHHDPIYIGKLDEILP